jgi:hypothetical protein
MPSGSKWKIPAAASGHSVPSDRSVAPSSSRGFSLYFFHAIARTANLRSERRWEIVNTACSYSLKTRPRHVVRAIGQLGTAGAPMYGSSSPRNRGIVPIDYGTSIVFIPGHWLFERFDVEVDGAKQGIVGISISRRHSSTREAGHFSQGRGPNPSMIQSIGRIFPSSFPRTE